MRYATITHKKPLIKKYKTTFLGSQGIEFININFNIKHHIKRRFIFPSKSFMDSVRIKKFIFMLVKICKANISNNKVYIFIIYLTKYFSSKTIE